MMLLSLLFCLVSPAQENRMYKIFQFPPDRIPRIDGSADDWDMVPSGYTVGMDRLWDDSKKHEQADSANLDVQVTIGWVRGMNRLYVLYQAYDDYWDFSRPGLHNDTFELIVDGDRSGGPFIDRFHWDKNMSPMEAYLSFHGVHAQNYHMFTPAGGKDWALVWGSQPWIKELPWANAAYGYDFRPGESGKLILECWITPFDYAGNDPSRAVESLLVEDKEVGLCWAVIDYDSVDKEGNNGFWNLSPEHTMYGNASFALPFRLMPLEKQFRNPVEARWDFQVVDMNRRLVVFTDRSVGKIDSWKWDFGDGCGSIEQHPVHAYAQPGKYTVVLWVEGPEGGSRFSRVWDVAVK